MRLARPLIFTASLALLGSSLAFTSPHVKQDPEANAETQYKNITSFKGQKAKEVIPAMHFMSSALGQQCSFCHVENDFASEKKPEKATAREMIAMTKGINERDFNGRPVITCNTCHNGKAHPAGMPGGVAVRPNLRPNDAVKVDAVLASFAKASGFDSSKPTTIVLTGKTVRNEQEIGDLETKEASDGRFLDVTKGGYTQGYDGKNPWVNIGGHAMAVPRPNGDAILRYGGFFWTSAPALTETTAGKEQMNGKPYDVVRGKITGADVTAKFFFDPETHLLARIAYFDRTVLGTMGDVYDYADYKSVGGIMVPMTVTHYESISSKMVRKYTDAKTATAVDADFVMH
ncbi:MAG: c-type cytochrome [bacterium]